MRRPFALLALAVTSWSHVAALHCQVGIHAAAPGADAHTHAMPASPGQPPEAEPDERPGAYGHPSEVQRGVHQHGSTDGDEDCRSASACGTVMIETVRAVRMIRLPAASRAAAPQVATAVSAAPLTADPPPPRPIV